MAEPPAPLVSVEPRIEKLGLKPLIHDTAPCDPFCSDHPAEEVEMELGELYERELIELIILQAEIEAKGNLVEENEAVVDRGEEGNGWEIGEGGEFGEDKVGKRGGDFEKGIGNEKGEEMMKLGIQNWGINRRRMNYPMRPDAEDCAHYMKFGFCKFGFSCKFNHPPRRNNQVKEKPKLREENSERTGQTECKYYLTSGGCRYGKDCKFSHDLDKSSSSNNLVFNFLGLPIRPGEKECPYYMRNGSCRYGSNCRFHHPEPQAVAGGVSPSSHSNGGSVSSRVSVPSVSSWSQPMSFPDTPFVPVMFPPTQGGAVSTPEWNVYQAVAYPTSEKGLPRPPAFAMKNVPSELSLPKQHQREVEEYPERPGEPECSFFLKTGDCKFKFNCKFHHPQNRDSHAKVNSFSLNDRGLPLRPDQPICSHYDRYGICKYGPGCKYDHPSKFVISQSPEVKRPPKGDAKTADGAETSKQGN